jgi:uncharacterized protein YozE (UPF0346 family)
MEKNISEKSYRRGCHQTAAKILAEVQRLPNKEKIVRFLEALTGILHDLRYDPKPHPVLLDVALEETAAGALGSFYRWLSGQKHRTDPVGDLARDAVADAQFPRCKTRRCEFEDYFWSVGASKSAIVALRRAWTEYRKARTQKNKQR